MNRAGWGAASTAEPSRQHRSRQLIEADVIGGVGAYGVETGYGRFHQTCGAGFVHSVAGEGVEEAAHAGITRVVETDSSLRGAVDDVALHQIVVAANINRIEDVGLGYCVLGNSVGIAVAGARATKCGVDEDPDLRVPDNVPRHCDPL